MFVKQCGWKRGGDGVLAVVHVIGGSRQRCRSGCKHGSDGGIAGTCVYRKYPVGISQCDVKWSTRNKFSRWSTEVVNPHSGPVFAKILKIVRGEREPIQARARVGGRQPTQADTHGGGSTKK